MGSWKVRRAAAVAAIVTLAAGALTVAGAAPARSAAKVPPAETVFFAADGLRQDLVEEYASRGLMPTMRDFLRYGTRATDGGLLTQAPPNTGAGWYSLATGAWPGVHRVDEQHVPRQRPAVRQPHRSIRSRRPAGRIHRPGGRAGWAQGRPGGVGRRAQRGDLRADHRLPPVPLGPWRGDELHRRTGRAAVRRRPVHRLVRPAVRSPGWLRRPGAVPRRRPDARDRLDRRAAESYSPPMEMRLRVLDFGVDKYGLNAYIVDSTDDGHTNYDRVMFSRTKDAADAVGTLRAGEWADVKVTIAGGALAGMTAGMLVKVEELSPDLSQRPAVPHVRQPGDRHMAVVAGCARLHRRLRRVPRPGVPDVHGRRLRHPRGRRRERGDVRRAGQVLGDGPPADDGVRRRDVRARPAARRHADHRRVPAPVPRPRHEDAAGRRPQPGLRRRRSERRARRPRRGARALHPEAYQEADETLALARKLMGRSPNTFVSSDHGFAPQFLAIDASLPLVELGLLSGRRRRTAARRPVRPSARPRPAGPAGRCRSTSTSPAAIRLVAASPRSPPGTSSHGRRRSRPSTSGSWTPTIGPTTASRRAGR